MKSFKHVIVPVDLDTLTLLISAGQAILDVYPSTNLNNPGCEDLKKAVEEANRVSEEAVDRRNDEILSEILALCEGESDEVKDSLRKAFKVPLS